MSSKEDHCTALPNIEHIQCKSQLKATIHCFSMQSETSLRKQWLYDVISQTAQNAGNSTQLHVHEHVC